MEQPILTVIDLIVEIATGSFRRVTYRSNARRIVPANMNTLLPILISDGCVFADAEKSWLGDRIEFLDLTGNVQFSGIVRGKLLRRFDDRRPRGSRCIQTAMSNGWQNVYPKCVTQKS